MEYEINIDKIVLEERPVSFTPKIVELEYGRRRKKALYIGNTGLKFTVLTTDPGKYKMDYMPDGYVGVGMKIDEATKVKYATLFGAAFYQFCVWCLKEREIKDITPPGAIKGKTNPKMNEFMAYIFNKDENIHSSMPEIFYQYNFEIDMKKILDNPKMLDMLKKYYDRATTQNYKMLNFYNKKASGETTMIHN